MKTHHRVAVPLAGLLSAMIVVDTVAVAVTGERTFLTDDEKGTRLTAILMSVVLGLGGAALFAVVRAERARFEAASPVARRTRVPLLVGLGLFAVGNGVLHPLELAAGLEEGPVTTVSGLLAASSLLLVFVPLLVLGLASLRHNPFGLGGRVLALVGPAILVTAALAVVAPAVAAPVLVTDVALLGVALLGVRAAPLLSPVAAAAAADATDDAAATA